MGFYAYSVAYGSVPIFLPVWWPHSFYNTRYGMEMLPAFALGVGFAGQFFIAAAGEFKPGWAKYAAGILFLFVGVNAWQVVRERPLVYVEGTKNIEARRAYERDIPPALRGLLTTRPGGEVLMITSVYPEIVALTGIPLKQTINESDKEFFWAALASPATQAALVSAFDGDEVDQGGPRASGRSDGGSALRDSGSAAGNDLHLRCWFDGRAARAEPTCAVIASGRNKMNSALAQFAQPFDFDRLQQIVVVNGAIGRLLMACLLGGAIGLERE